MVACFLCMFKHRFSLTITLLSSHFPTRKLPRVCRYQKRGRYCLRTFIAVKLFCFLIIKLVSLFTPPPLSFFLVLLRVKDSAYVMLWDGYCRRCVFRETSCACERLVKGRTLALASTKNKVRSLKQHLAFKSPCLFQLMATKRAVSS